MIDNYILGFDITMHNTSAVTEIQGFQQFEEVESYLHVVHVGNQRSEINIVQVIENLG